MTTIHDVPIAFITFRMPPKTVFALALACKETLKNCKIELKKATDSVFKLKFNALFDTLIHQNNKVCNSIAKLRIEMTLAKHGQVVSPRAALLTLENNNLRMCYEHAGWKTIVKFEQIQDILTAHKWVSGTMRIVEHASDKHVRNVIGLFEQFAKRLECPVDCEVTRTVKIKAKINGMTPTTVSSVEPDIYGKPIV
jgi:hypothetical protein